MVSVEKSVTAFRLSLRFGYPRTRNAGVIGIPSGVYQNADSELKERTRHGMASTCDSSWTTNCCLKSEELLSKLNNTRNVRQDWI